MEWNDIREDIFPQLWAQGQPDGTKMDEEEQVQFCVAVQKAGLPGGKLFDKACNEKKIVMCEENEVALPNHMD